jgi:hypothetical protein
MSDTDRLDLLLGVYADPNLAQKDFRTFVKLVENKTISTDGIMLISKDPAARCTSRKRMTTRSESASSAEPSPA